MSRTSVFERLRHSIRVAHTCERLGFMEGAVLSGIDAAAAVTGKTKRAHHALVGA